MKRPNIEALEKDHTPKHAYNSMVVCPHEWEKLLSYIRHLEALIVKDHEAEYGTKERQESDGEMIAAYSKIFASKQK